MPIISNFPGGSGSGGAGQPLAAVSNIKVLTASGKVYVKWTDPDDMVVGDATLATWAGTMLVRKAGSVPTSRRDGTIVLDSKERNKYQNTYFCDTGLTNGTQYFYKLFPYTTSNTYTNSPENEFNATPEAIPMGDVSDIALAAAGNGKLSIKWTDPAATIDSDSVTLATWASTVVVVKAGSYATSPTDPDAVYTYTSTTRNAYATNPLVATGLTNGTTYYVSLFPMSADGAANINAANRKTGIANRITISSIPSQNGTLTYNTNSQVPTWSNYNSAQLALGGDTSGINAGAYDATFTPKDDYMWADGSTDTKTVTWNIGRKAIAKVTAATTTWAYDGAAHIPSWSGYSADAMTISGTSTAQTEVGNYSTTFTLNGNHQWSDGTTTAIKIDWSVSVRSITAPSANTTSFTYTGAAQVPTFTYDSNYVTISGDSAAKTAVGTYTVTFTLKNTTNTKWVDNTTAAKSIVWSIGRASINVPTVSGTKTYNGSEQTVTLSGYDSAKMTLGGTQKATNAGTYTVTATPTASYQWSDGSTGAKNISWSIAKAAGSLTLSKSSVTLNTSTLTDTVTVTRSGDGAISATSSNTGIATVSVSGTTVTIKHVNQTSGSATITIKVAAGTNHNAPANKTVSVTAQFMPIKKALNDQTWAEIRQVSDAGKGSEYWNVGDRKGVLVKGTVGTLAVNTTLYVYILGFNHNSAKEGAGIHFGTFKSALTNGADVCLIDSYYGSYQSYNGTKYFQMNHWGTSSNYNTNYGGWKACDMRYDILGSTNKAPSGYGAQKTTSVVGYDAPTNTATSPVANTLMAALPSDLRAVMKPITKYTDSVGNSSNVAGNVTASVDYLPLLAEFEIFGTRSYANQYEQNSQVQYDYYKSGNSKVKYRHSSTGSTAIWWERSPNYYTINYFCYVNTNGGANYYFARFSRGLAPAFMV